MSLRIHSYFSRNLIDNSLSSFLRNPYFNFYCDPCLEFFRESLSWFPCLPRDLSWFYLGIFPTGFSLIFYRNSTQDLSRNYIRDVSKRISEIPSSDFSRGIFQNSSQIFSVFPQRFSKAVCGFLHRNFFRRSSLNSSQCFCKSFYLLSRFSWSFFRNFVEGRPELLEVLIVPSKIFVFSRCPTVTFSRDFSRRFSQSSSWNFV